LVLAVLHKLLLEDLTVAILFFRLSLLRAVVVAVTVLHLQRKQVALEVAVKVILLELVLLGIHQAHLHHKETTAETDLAVDLAQVVAVAVAQVQPEEME
jgi:hypothetical protein